MTKRARPSDVVYWILYARNRTPELMLPNVLINSHGDPGKIYVGGKPIVTGMFDECIMWANGTIFSELQSLGSRGVWRLPQRWEFDFCRVRHPPTAAQSLVYFGRGRRRMGGGGQGACG